MAKLKRKIKAVKEEEKEYIVVAGSDLADAVERDLGDREGVFLFGNEQVMDDYLQLPSDITEVNSQELGRYFNAFTQQKMYSRTLVGRMATTVREMNWDLDSLRSEVYSDMPPKTSIKEKELKFQADTRAKESLDEVHFYNEKLRMVSDYLESLIDGITLISREISRREADWNDERREENIGKKRR